MDRGNFISQLGLAIGCLVACIVVGIVAWGYFAKPRSTGPVDSTVAQSKSSPGWGTRYTATVALARRGSEHAASRLSVFQEMLDEDQQRCNFTESSKDGRAVVNEAEAFQTVTNALKALAELHRARPEVDLSSLYPAIDRLAASNNPALRTEAARAKVELGI